MRLIDWKDHANDGIKYYSGTAKYTKKFDLPAEISLKDKPIYLDLGDVKDMAEVRLNGLNLGVLWCKPFRVNISQALKSGSNILEIKVVNRWSNRLLGDRLKGEHFTGGNASHAGTLFHPACLVQ